MLERRAFSRADCNVDATLDYAGESFPSAIINLSLNGTLINTAASPRKGERVVITFSFAEADKPRTARCPGRVVRADTKGLGIEFEALDAEGLEHLREIVAAHSEKPDAIDEEFARAVEGRSGDAQQ